ncbi:MAG: radical SAM protein [Planctomycetes bacterium]|nr:radical SAM protein [Planctomycetota bacterium]
MLGVCEIFTSIQGETSYAGRPCTFVRLSGCNLSCTWCDTEYARTEPGESLSIDEIVESVIARGVPLVCLTGGEPLLQEEAPQLAARLCQEDYTVLVETNGSQDISLLEPPAIRIMDIKTPSSGESEAMDWNNAGRLRLGDEVKFIIANRSDYDWAKENIIKYDIDQQATILLGTAHGTSEDPEEKFVPPAQLAGWILADRLNARLQVQLHKLLWPDKNRGV